MPVELFECPNENPPWTEDADDVDIAINETERTTTGRSCRVQLHTVCRTLEVQGQVVGVCKPITKPTGNH